MRECDYCEQEAQYYCEECAYVFCEYHEDSVDGNIVCPNCRNDGLVIL